MCVPFVCVTVFIVLCALIFHTQEHCVPCLSFCLCLSLFIPLFPLYLSLSISLCLSFSLTGKQPEAAVETNQNKGTTGIVE